MQLLVDARDLLVGVRNLGSAVLNGDEHTARAVEHGIGSGHLPAREAVAVIHVVELAVTVEIQGHVLAVGVQHVQSEAAVLGGGVQLVHRLVQLLHEILVEDHAGGDAHGGVGEDVTRHDVGVAAYGEVLVAALIPPRAGQIYGSDLAHVVEVVTHGQIGEGILVADEHIVIVQTAADLLLGGIVDHVVGIALIGKDEFHAEILGDHGVALVEGIPQHVALHALHHEIIHAIVADEDGELAVILFFIQLIVGRLGFGLGLGARLGGVVRTGGVFGALAAGDSGEEQARAHQQGEEEGCDALRVFHGRPHILKILNQRKETDQNKAPQAATTP